MLLRSQMCCFFILSQNTVIETHNFLGLYVLSYLLTYLLHGAESFLRS